VQFKTGFRGRILGLIWLSCENHANFILHFFFNIIYLTKLFAIGLISMSHIIERRSAKAVAKKRLFLTNFAQVNWNLIDRQSLNIQQMQSVDFQRKSNCGSSLHFQHWPLPEARAVVCIVHGMGEHVGRYAHVANFFSKKGIATFGFDLQGHGRTTGKRGHSEGLVSMLDDIDLLLDEATQHYPYRPIFLYGHSMGGNLVLNHVLRRKPNIQGVVATAPWIRLPNPPSPFLVGFAKIMCHVMPKFTQPNGLDINGLSNDPEVVKAYQADPLVHDRVTVKTGAEMLAGADWLNKYAGPAPCPILLMHGGNDHLTSPSGTSDFAKRLTGKVTWKQWPGLQHEIHNEPQQAEVLAFLVEWIEQFI
jgi:alpha-beta hydrolase superfamily lysophospholipase